MNEKRNTITKNSIPAITFFKDPLYFQAPYSVGFFPLKIKA